MTDEEYMQLALMQAREAEKCDEVPIGAVVVCDGKVLSSAHNLRESTNDPAGHAEFIALKKAAETLGAWRLSDCVVYVTLEPCLMCAGLMHQSRIKRCVYGAPDPKAGALGTLYSVHSDERLNHVFEVSAGVCQEECANLLSEFFSAKRKKKQ
ncbi:MAG: tRNA adenosine(34) deaminase TadA [Eggerthellaceae bacterium]|jgi:tRNA(adenine34) deaminase|nr:tRNA adenosine(34) deaminase TadA [Eggerthellaceae bacterium]